MRNLKQTFRKIVNFLNNPEEDGGFWLPNIQRPFVWSEEQICRLFDSILREYPISTLLVWKTTSDIRRRRFIDTWHDGVKLSDFYVPQDRSKKCLVLDGQQRFELFPQSATKFVELDQSAEVEFVVGPDGKPSHMLLGGQVKAARIADEPGASS